VVIWKNLLNEEKALFTTKEMNIRKDVSTAETQRAQSLERRDFFGAKRG
jgi:hypothetical protein